MGQGKVYKKKLLGDDCYFDLIGSIVNLCWL